MFLRLRLIDLEIQHFRSNFVSFFRRFFSFACPHSFSFLRMGQSRPLFDYFRLFHTIQIFQIDVLGTRTRGGRMEGEDDSTELWRHPSNSFSYSVNIFRRSEVVYWQSFSVGKAPNEQK